MNHLKTLILSLLFYSSANAVQISPLAGANMTFGGDPLAYVVFTDGSRSDLEAGRGFTGFGGVIFEDIWSQNNHTIDAQTTLGVKFASTKAATNGEVTFTRWPLEAIIFYRNTEHKYRGGLGLSYHLAGNVSGTEDASAIAADIDNVLGFVLQADYFLGWNNQMALGLRYESISYKISNQNFTASGNNFGVNFTYYWRTDQ